MPTKDPRKELILFLEEHPEYYPVIRSALYIRILKWLSGKARTMTDIESHFLNIDREDLEMIIDSLLGLGLVTEIKTPTTIVYYLNNEGKELLEKFKNAKQKFKIA